TWHPNQYGWNTDYQGPHDGHHMALLALESRTTGRIGPCSRTPWLGKARGRRKPPLEDLVRGMSERSEPAWKVGSQPTQPGERVYWIHRDYYGFAIFQHAGFWFGTRTGSGPLDVRRLRRGDYRQLWKAATKDDLVAQLPVDREGWERAV